MGKRKEKAARTKAAIVENAMRLFSERGFDSVTVEEITRAAGVAKGTFYSYFSVKTEIIVEEFWKIDRYYQAYGSRNLSRYKTPAEKLRAFTRAQMRFVRDEIGNEHLKILYVNQTLQTGQDKVILNPERQWYRIIGEVIKEGQAAGDFRTDVDSSELAYEFNRTIRSIFLDWCITDGGIDLVKEGQRCLNRWLLPALRSTPEHGDERPQRRP